MSSISFNPKVVDPLHNDPFYNDPLLKSKLYCAYRKAGNSREDFEDYYKAFCMSVSRKVFEELKKDRAYLTSYVNDSEEFAEALYDLILKHVKVEGHSGYWHQIDKKVVDGEVLYLLEHDTFGDEVPCIIVNRKFEVVMDDVWNGFEELQDR